MGRGCFTKMEGFSYLLFLRNFDFYKGGCKKTPHKKTDKPALAGFIGLFLTFSEILDFLY